METNLTPSLSWLAPLFSAVVSMLFFALLGHGLRKVRGTDPVSATSWWAAASVAGGSGLWAAQFMALGGLGPQWAVYDADVLPAFKDKPVKERFGLCPWGLYHIEVKKA